MLIDRFVVPALGDQALPVLAKLGLAAGVVTIRRSVSEQGCTTTVSGTKTHQSRRISLDAATVALLTGHREQLATRLAELGGGFDEQGFVFSYQLDHSRPCSPSGVTRRYARMVARLGIRTHLHAIRHYSATELLASGFDLRAVAGWLGHGSGGATTLKVYAAWVARADQQVSELLAARLPTPRAPTRPRGCDASPEAAGEFAAPGGEAGE